jgi:integrase
LAAEQLIEVRLDGGERLPIIGRVDDAPLVMPTVYAVAMLRSGGRSPNTIAAHLRAIMIAHRWAGARGFSLEERMQGGVLLNEREIEDLTRVLRSRQDSLRLSDSGHEEVPPARRSSGAEAFRRSSRAPAEGVDPGTSANRIRFVRDYIVWLARSSRKPGIGAEIDLMASRLSARARTWPDVHSAPRTGLDTDQRTRLLAVSDPASPDNPFSHPPTRFRNALIVRLLYATGARRGEVAGLKIRDIDPKAATISIHRRGHDPDDPRPNPPRAKTLSRAVPCDPVLIRDLSAYIVDVRRCETRSKSHPFVFVSHRGTGPGAPLSDRQIGKVFEVLSGVLGFDLHAHLLRHTWNDRFSEMQDARPDPKNEAAEERVRGVLMGWSPQSKMPARYSRRHIEKAAEDAMQTMSKGLILDE